MCSCDGNEAPLKQRHEQALAGPEEEASVPLNDRQAMSAAAEVGREGELAPVMGEVEGICWTAWSVVSGALRATPPPLGFGDGQNSETKTHVWDQPRLPKSG